MILIYIILAILAVALLWLWFSYNGFVKFINRAKEAWADIDVQLKRRYDLIPNLVNTVKGYAAHESTLFEKVTAARTSAMRAGNLSEKSQTENALAENLKTVFALAENYPDLKANENFMELQKELADTENKIQSARRFYNSNVRDLNIAIDSFPQNMVAKIFNFVKMEYFELEQDSAAKEPVEVKF